MKSVRKNRRKRETLSNLIMKRKDTKKKKNTKKRKKNKMNRTRKKNKKRKKRKNRTISQKGGLVESVPSLSGTSILQTIGLPWWVTWSHVGGTAMSGLIIAGIAGVVYLLRNQIFAGAKAGAKAVKEGTKAATEKLKEGKAEQPEEEQDKEDKDKEEEDKEDKEDKEEIDWTSKDKGELKSKLDSLISDFEGDNKKHQEVIKEWKGFTDEEKVFSNLNYVKNINQGEIEENKIKKTEEYKDIYNIYLNRLDEKDVDKAKEEYGINQVWTEKEMEDMTLKERKKSSKEEMEGILKGEDKDEQKNEDKDKDKDKDEKKKDEDKDEKKKDEAPKIVEKVKEKAIGKIEDAIGAVSTDQLGPDIRKALNMG